MKTFYWLLKREFWEHRGGFLWAPVITGGIFLLLNIMGIVTAEVLGARHGVQLNLGGSGGLRYVMQHMDKGDTSTVGAALDLTMYSAMMIIAVTLGFVVFFYCLGALYNERSDRSILFWKSLPVSDSATVLSKLASALVVAPAIAVLTAIAVGLVQLLIVATVLSFHGLGVWRLLWLGHPFQVTANLIGSLPLYALWALPAAGWLMFCSAWVRGKPFLWAVAVPVVTGVLITWFDIMGLFNQTAGWFWSNVVVRSLFSVFPGSDLSLHKDAFQAAARLGPDHLFDALNLATTYQALGSANLWIGAVCGVALIAGAIWCRRWRNEA